LVGMNSVGGIEEKNGKERKAQTQEPTEHQVSRTREVLHKHSLRVDDLPGASSLPSISPCKHTPGMP